MASATSVDEVIDAFCAVLEDLTGPHAERTRARYALFLEVIPEPEIQAPLRAQRAAFAEWTLTVDPDAALRPIVAVAVRGVLAP